MKYKTSASIIACFIFVLTANQLLFAFGSKGSTDKPWRLYSVEGKIFYTKANIFYQKQLKIVSTNYHKGKLYPVGSKVTIRYAGENEIEFRDDEGKTFVLVLLKKHSSETITLRNYFDQHFIAENPLGPNGQYARFDDTEKRNIKNGTIEKGMSKAAVLMAYGYPPSHVTPDVKNDKWTYWKNKRHKPIDVHFKDDRLLKIVKANLRSIDE